MQVFRRYSTDHPGKTFVVMDAPPGGKLSCIRQPFRAHCENWITSPEIIHADLTRGFLVLTDFGDATYLKTLSHANADALYGEALDAPAIL